jgi:hypothetical protein
MSSTNQPFGLVPSFHPTGLDRAVALTDGIASGYSSSILKGQPVALNSSGVIVAATAGSAYQGAFAGVQWTDTTRRGYLKMTFTPTQAKGEFIFIDSVSTKLYAIATPDASETRTYAG